MCRSMGSLDPEICKKNIRFDEIKNSLHELLISSVSHPIVHKRLNKTMQILNTTFFFLLN